MRQQAMADQARRNCLLISCVLICLPFLCASAVLAPNMSSCNPPSDLPEGEDLFSCCAPLAQYAPTLFTPNFSSSALRVRRPAHLADTVYAQKLARAYALMKELPPEDPRSFMQQANIHCAFCNSVYNQVNSSELFQVHGTWLFFPFHRWYIYFHERILGKLLGEDDFALPFWNYDHPDGATIPWLYSSYNLTLADNLRDYPRDLPPAVAGIDYLWVHDEHRPREVQLHENNNSMFRAVMRASSAESFFGKPFRQGDTPIYGAGSVETVPHNSVHNWVGQSSQIGWKDMGSFYAAARDPLFYAHHASLDRFWDVWKELPDHEEFQDSDFLNAEFAFYNENAELVRVKVSDALDSANLGYTYQEVENPWMEAKPVRKSEGPAMLTSEDKRCVEGEAIEEACSWVAERNVEMMGKGEAEYMVFTCEYGPSELALLRVYVNLPSADAYTGTGCEEFVEYMSVFPRYEDTSANVSSKIVKAEITQTLSYLNLTQETSLVVTMVPSGNLSSAQFTMFNFSIVYASTSLLASN